MNWEEKLRTYNRDGITLFGQAFLKRWGEEEWKPSEADRKAAASFHIQIASRITTQRLGYSSGVEATALSSVYQLFDKAREIAEEAVEGRHFETLTWYVLNTHVRPFTAKWHRRSQNGGLEALDTTDEFRAELTALQPLLSRFDDLLLEMRDGKAPPTAQAPAADRRVAAEMARELPWGIPDNLVPVVAGSAAAAAINDAERTFILASRAQRTPGANPPHATGLALSGGGIRSATFSLGVLIALARRNVLPQIDYLSTVSGGGYLGAFITTFLDAPPEHGQRAVGLGRDQIPFHRAGGEPAALRHIRHYSRYLLTGSWAERLQLATAQMYGILMNALAITLLVSFVALAEALTRRGGAAVGDLLALAPDPGPWIGRNFAATLATALALIGIVLQLVMGAVPGFRDFGSRSSRWISVALVAAVAWYVLGAVHRSLSSLPAPQWSVAAAGLLGLALLLLGVSALGRRLGQARPTPVLLAALSTPLLLAALELAVYQCASRQSWTVMLLAAVVLAGILGLLFVATDVNLTSLHRFYRDRLAGTFLIQAPPTGDAGPFRTSVNVRLSAVRPESGAPYPLLNGALNVPGSRNAAMQGRLTDFFLFSPRYCGSPLVGYRPTADWEAVDPDLNVGTAMAISAAAASPQMGLKRLGRVSFWLALLNIRLGYWVRVPGSGQRFGPGYAYLLKEMFGRMDENGSFLNVSDGGHIENLGVYELLRRRCKYIIAIDGEQDPRMTFHALTNLQRLAAIDMDVRIDVDLDDLRLGANGLSRSHFKFCRVHYPGPGDPVGYLLYLKLSLTGNEGEFIRRYRLDEPDFPHHSTADQFFTEAQYEAYRALGEHIGDKLFLKAIVGPLAGSNNVAIEDWFSAIGSSMLEPRPQVAEPVPAEPGHAAPPAGGAEGDH